MSKQAWKNQEKIFHKALGLSGREREAFLQKACAGDEIRLSEVTSLLTAFENDADFLENCNFGDHLALLNAVDSDGLENSEIGSYRIRARIGEGGMGKVYDATDVRLNRRVALKFISESFDDDNLARRRLLREAQAAAMLDHPNICSIYGIEQVEEKHFIVMQYVDGFTLADLIKESPIDQKRVPEIFRQIVSAVAFAHSHGIIHRDLKPANIMIRGDDQIKVLDFGLAKTVRPTSDENPSSRISQNGLIIGTVSYMSPEQLRGERLDFQTDIFSIGIILYELITGKNPFARKSQAETIASVLGDRPPTEDLNGRVSDNLLAVVRKCLEKDKADRFQSAAEILVYLETLAPNRKHVSSLRIRRRPLLVVAVLLLLALLAITAFLSFREPANPNRSLAILPIANETGDPANDYLSDGLTDSLTTRLSGLSQIHVTPPTLVSRYKDEIDPITIGAQLHVEVVLRARLFRVGNSLYLQAVLVNTADGQQLGSIDFETDKTNLINSQEMIATLIISKLQISPSESELQLLKKRQTFDATANDALFQGRYFLDRRSRGPENLDKAISFFDKAIEIDPLYAKAWAGLAESYVLKSLPGYGSLTPGDAMSKAKAAANTALKLDDKLSEAYTSMGIIRSRYDWNWIEAENNFLKAIELDPDYAPAHYSYSRLLIISGNFDRALAEAFKAKDLDPLSVDFASHIGRIYYCQRQPDKAIQTLSRIREENPGDTTTVYLLGLVYLQEGRDKEALDIFEKSYEKTKIYFAAPLGYTYGRLKRKQDALRVLSDLENIAKKDVVVPPQERALIYLGMGDEEKAFELFTQSCHDRFPALPGVLAEFFFDPYRNDKRFKDLQNCVTPLS